MAQQIFANRRGIAHKGSSGMSPVFPDVCKTPAPPAPFVPIPYPNVGYQTNLASAGKTDAQAKAGNDAAKKKQKKAISQLKEVSGYEAKSAVEAVKVGRTLQLKGPTKLSHMKVKFEDKSVYRAGQTVYHNKRNLID